MVLPDIEQIMKTGLGVRTILSKRMLTYRRHISIIYTHTYIQRLLRNKFRELHT